MSQTDKTPSLLDLFPEENREAADLLKQAVPMMVRHVIPPTPVHFALWYAYCRGQDQELNRRLDKILSDFDSVPPEVAAKLFREHIIHGELEAARKDQQHLLELVDDIEGNVLSSVQGSRAYQDSLNAGLEALRDPASEELPDVLSELQASTLAMQAHQEKFLYRLQTAQAEIQHLRQQLKQAHQAATLDGLTQVFNRASFNRLLHQALERGHQGLALVMLDIDHFKYFNDQYGHPLGDRVLQHVGQLLREMLPAGGIAARYGGEEFCVILLNCPDLGTAQQFAEQMRQKLQALRVKARHTDQVLNTITASFGIALGQADDSPESLLQRADDALYQAKRNGRNQIQPALEEPQLSA